MCRTGRATRSTRPTRHDNNDGAWERGSVSWHEYYALYGGWGWKKLRVEHGRFQGSQRKWGPEVESETRDTRAKQERRSDHVCTRISLSLYLISHYHHISYLVSMRDGFQDWTGLAMHPIIRPDPFRTSCSVDHLLSWTTQAPQKFLAFGLVHHYESHVTSLIRPPLAAWSWRLPSEWQTFTASSRSYVLLRT